MESLDFDEPLPKVTCTSTNCEEGLHCFRPKREKPETLSGGNCHACDADLVDWQKVYDKSHGDIDFLFRSMRHEFIRDKYWTIPISESTVRNYYFHGKKHLSSQVEERLKKSVMPPGRKLFRDGTQTPVDQENIIYYAQHATATCCRKCMKYWHNIPYENELSLDDINYFKMLILKYIESRLPNLSDDGAQLKMDF